MVVAALVEKKEKLPSVTWREMRRNIAVFVQGWLAKRLSLQKRFIGYTFAIAGVHYCVCMDRGRGTCLPWKQEAEANRDWKHATSANSSNIVCIHGTFWSDFWIFQSESIQ